MKLYKITPKVHKYYQERVSGNENASQTLTRRKLTRNIKLAVKSPSLLHDKYDIYFYGNLDIVVNPKTDRIISIRNWKGASVGWFVKDEEKYNELNKKYGIDVLEADMEVV